MLEKLLNYLDNKKILILGFGKEGESSYLFLRKHFPEKKLEIVDKNMNLLTDKPYLLEDINVEVVLGEDLFEKENLKETFIELCGFGETKPFECVGTYEEVQYAISKTIEKLESNNKSLPFLLNFYKENYDLRDGEFLKFYNENNHLPKEFDQILRRKIFEN